MSGMEFSDGFVSNEHRELHRSATESADPLSVSPLHIGPKSPKSPKSPMSPNSPRSPKMQGKTGTASPLAHDRHSHSQVDGCPEKGGSGGKGTWGGLLDTDDGCTVDPSDPNFDSSEEREQPNAMPERVDFEEYKKKSTVIVEEFFVTDDITSPANELRELDMPSYSFYFVKKLISKAMDRHDKEKEMAAVLLSALYADFIEPSQVYKGFCKLVESADDLIVDIPDTVDVLALFIARAVVDDILPPAFLKKEMSVLPKDSKGVEVLKRSEKG